MISVILSINSLAPESGGPAVTVPTLCHALTDCGVQVGLLTGIAESQDVAESLAHEGVFVKFVGGRGNFGKYREFMLAMSDFRRDFGADILHDNGLWLPVNHAVIAVARRDRIPLVITCRGMLEPWALRHKMWKKKLAWWLYQKRDLRAARVLHATAEEEAQNLRRLGFKQPIAVIPNGVELPPATNHDLSTSGQRTVLFMSRIHPIKGLLNLVAAWSKVRPFGWQVLIAGPDEGGHRAKVERAIKEAALVSDFRFVGSLEGQEKWDAYQQADLFVLPTFSENFGVVVAEALAAGVPVITTKGAPWKLLEEHNCGWWVDIGIEPLAEALNEAVSISDGERREMGLRGRKLVKERFAWPKIAAQMKSVYEWILGGGTMPECVIWE